MTTPALPSQSIYEYAPRRPRTSTDALTSEDKEMARIILTQNAEDNADDPFEAEESQGVLHGVGTEDGNQPQYIATSWGQGENPTITEGDRITHKPGPGPSTPVHDDAYGVDRVWDEEMFDNTELEHRLESERTIPGEDAQVQNMAGYPTTSLKAGFEAEDEYGDTIEEGALNTDQEEALDGMMEAAQVDNYSLDTFEDGLAEEDVDLLAGSEKTPELDFVKKLNKKPNKYKYTHRPGRKYPTRERNISAGERLLERLRERATEKRGDGPAEAPAPEIEVPEVPPEPAGTPPTIDPTSGLVIPGTGGQRRESDEEGPEFAAQEQAGSGDGEPESQQRGPINLDGIPSEEESRERVKGDLDLGGADAAGGEGPRNLKEVLGTRRGRERRRRRGRDKKGRGNFGR